DRRGTAPHCRTRDRRGSRRPRCRARAGTVAPERGVSRRRGGRHAHPRVHGQGVHVGRRVTCQGVLMSARSNLVPALVLTVVTACGASESNHPPSRPAPPRQQQLGGLARSVGSIGTALPVPAASTAASPFHRVADVSSELALLEGGAFLL